MGQLKITTVPQNNSSNDVLVKNNDGTIEKRDVSTLGNIPSTAVVLSETEINVNLINAGFENIGFINIPLVTERKW